MISCFILIKSSSVIIPCTFKFVNFASSSATANGDFFIFLSTLSLPNRRCIIITMPVFYLTSFFRILLTNCIGADLVRPSCSGGIISDPTYGFNISGIIPPSWGQFWTLFVPNLIIDLEIADKLCLISIESYFSSLSGFFCYVCNIYSCKTSYFIQCLS